MVDMSYGLKKNNALLHEPKDHKGIGAHQCAIRKKWATWHQWGGIACDLIVWDIKFLGDFTLCKIDEVHLILEETFIKFHMVDVKCKPVWLWCAMMAKQKLNLKLTKTPLVRGAKLNLVSMDQIKNKQLMVVVWFEQLQRTHGEANRNGRLPNHICGVLARYKDVATKVLLKNLRSTSNYRCPIIAVHHHF